MKKILFILLTLFTFQALAAPDAGVIDSPEPPLEPIVIENKFADGSFLGVGWGKEQKHIANKEAIEEFKKINVRAKIYKDKMVARGPTPFPFAPELLMMWGFDGGKLVYGSQVYLVPTEAFAELACAAIAGSTVEQYGPPHSNSSSSTLIWQNENTTLVMLCTNYGAVLDWYNTMWLQHNKTFTPHRAIPEEALNANFGKKVPGEVRNPTKDKGKPN